MLLRKTALFLFIGVLLPGMFGLAACSTPPSGPVAQATQTPVPANPNPGTNPVRGGNFSFRRRGTGYRDFLLEKTAAPITAQQAKELVPLWQQILLLTADSNATQEQIQAVYGKIEYILTADQMKSIEAVTLADMQSVMSILGSRCQPEVDLAPTVDKMTPIQISA